MGGTGTSNRSSRARAGTIARAALSRRELEVLACIAEGLTNHAIAGKLFLNIKSVESIVRSIFLKLGLIESEQENRRVRAARAYLLEHPEEGGLLPVIDASFVGRVADLAALDEAFASSRLVTIVGPAGIGKTRLAVEHGARRLDGGGSVRFADLAADMPGGVNQSVAAACGVSGETASALARQLARAGDRSPDMLVLDNAEHVIDEVAALVDALGICRRVRLLVTSREPLGVRGERVWTLLPLAAVDAHQLLIDRAKDAGAPVDLAVDPTISSWLDRLDGMPLAIELVASRLASLPSDFVGRHLEDLSSLLRWPGHRQGSLRVALRSSVDALDAGAQRLFEQLSVFLGGFTVDAAQRTFLGDEDGHGLEHLVRASLVRFDGVRYRMLEPIRQHATLLLIEHDGLAGAEAQLCRWAANFAGKAAAGILVDPRRWIPLLNAEVGNIAAALKPATEGRCRDDALRIVGHLGYHWTTNHGARWLGLSRAVLAAADGADPQWRARALSTVASLSSMMGEDVDPTPDFEEASRVLEAHGDLVGLLIVLYWHSRHTGDAGLHRRAVELSDALHVPFLQGWTRIAWATNEWIAGAPFADVEPLLLAALEVGADEGVAVVRAGALMRLAACRLFENHRAEQLLFPASEIRADADEAEALMRAAGDTWQTYEVVSLQAKIHLLANDIDRAARFVAEAIDVASTTDSRPLIADALIVAAAFASCRGDDDEAKRVVDAAASISPVLWNRNWLAVHGPCVTSAATNAFANPVRRLVTDVELNATVEHEIGRVREPRRTSTSSQPA